MQDPERDFQSPWKEWANKFGNSERATFKDLLQFDLEVKTISNLIKNRNEKIFEIGCGNGVTLMKLMDLGISPLAIGGCDIIKKFIEIAKKRFAKGYFFTMDITNLSDARWRDIYNFAPTTIVIKRVLCNLSGRKQVRDVLRKICSIMRKGCKVVLIEPILDGLQKVNVLRYIFGLDLIQEPVFNEYIRWYDVDYVLRSNSIKNIKKVDYTSTYYIGSRILQPFLWPDKEPQYNHPLNDIFINKLPNREGFGLHWLIYGVKK